MTKPPIQLSAYDVRRDDGQHGYSILHADGWEGMENSCKGFQSRLREATNRDGGYEVWFRGHSNAEWKLETTLERSTKKALGVSDYYRKIYAIKHEIEARTGKGWDIPDPQTFGTKFTDLNDLLKKENIQIVEYLVYLRHFGFPSPLLDWSRSPYVAAFFAFVDASETQAERVGIWAYIRDVGGMGHIGSSGTPTITAVGGYGKHDVRHFAQQSRYTMAAMHPHDGEWTFAHHQDGRRMKPMGQDELMLVTAPASERGKVLAQLEEYGLNDFTLFGNDEAMLRVLARREGLG